MYTVPKRRKQKGQKKYLFKCSHGKSVEWRKNAKKIVDQMFIFHEEHSSVDQVRSTLLEQQLLDLLLDGLNLRLDLRSLVLSHAG